MTTSLVFKPRVIGHRGACAYAPENTMSSFVKAAQLGTKWVEFDVQLALTGETIIFHDDYLDRTTDGHGEISHYPFAYLQSLDAGSWFNPRFSSERIPTLMTVIEFLQDAKISANIELKATPGQEKKLVEKIMAEMSPLLASSQIQFLFSSFSFEALRCLRDHSPTCQIGMLLDEWVDDWKEVCDSLHCVSVHVNHEILSPARARQIKETGRSLLCYTVNNPDKANELFSFGVDAVFSDVPDVIINGK